jgi:hypothetical protein
MITSLDVKYIWVAVQFSLLFGKLLKFYIHFYAKICGKLSPLRKVFGIKFGYLATNEFFWKCLLKKSWDMIFTILQALKVETDTSHIDEMLHIAFYTYNVLLPRNYCIKFVFQFNLRTCTNHMLFIIYLIFLYCDFVLARLSSVPCSQCWLNS